MNFESTLSFLAPALASYLAQFVKNPKSAKAKQLRTYVRLLNDATTAFLNAVPAPKE